MADDKKLAIPPAIYDYILYYECAQKDWLDYRKRTQVKGDGSLMDLIKWDVTYSVHPNDSGGETKFGVTKRTWQSYVESNPDKGYSKNLNSMTRQGWLDIVWWFWDSYSCASLSANYACACLLFQIAWGGFALTGKLVEALKQNADKTDYNFITSGGNYKKIADATHAYNNPMKAYGIMRSSLLSYYYNISRPDYVNKSGKLNSVFRIGWLNRAAIPFSLYGLYADVSLNGGNGLGLKYESTIADWDTAISQHIKNGAKGIVKLIDWGEPTESLEDLIAMAMPSSYYNNNIFGSDINSTYSSNYQSGPYSKRGIVNQLGNYSTTPDVQKANIQTKYREDVLNTLLGGSYNPDNVKKCTELITSDKRKSVQDKTKSKS